MTAKKDQRKSNKKTPSSVNVWPLAMCISLATALALVGCKSTKQPRGPMEADVKESGFLGDLYPKMHDGKAGQPLRVYRNQKVDALASNAYDKIVLDSVTIYYGPESRLKDVPEDQLKHLATVFAGELGEQLSKDFELVSTPGPKTLRIHTALTDAQGTKTALKAVSFIPWGVLGLKFAVLRSKELLTGKPVLSGEVTAEVKIMDSQTGEILFAAVDRRAGGRLGGGWKSWTDAQKSFQYWAEKTRYVLCSQLLRRTDCIQPAE